MGASWMGTFSESEGIAIGNEVPVVEAFAFSRFLLFKTER